MATVRLFDQVVTITYVYLGPAADRFVSRQISNHLAKRPDELVPDDLAALIDWIRLAMSFLTEDQAMIQEYTGRLALLKHGRRPVKKRATSSYNKSKVKKALTAHADAN